MCQCILRAPLTCRDTRAGKAREARPVYNVRAGRKQESTQPANGDTSVSRQADPQLIHAGVGPVLQWRIETHPRRCKRSGHSLPVLALHRRVNPAAGMPGPIPSVITLNHGPTSVRTAYSSGRRSFKTWFRGVIILFLARSMSTSTIPTCGSTPDARATTLPLGSATID